MSEWLEAHASAPVFLVEVRQLQECWRLPEHPFLQRLQRERVRADELRWLGAQYAPVLSAFAKATAAVASVVTPEWREELRGHAREKAAQAARCGRAREDGQNAVEVLPEALRCVQVWRSLAARDAVVGLTLLYALESAHAAIAETLQDPPAVRNGRAGGALNGYWRRVASQGEPRADALERMLAPLIETGERQADALDAANVALSAAWDLLNGLNRSKRRLGPLDGLALGGLFDLTIDPDASRG